MLETRDNELDSHKLIISDLKDNITDRKEDAAIIKQKLELAESDAGKALRALDKVSAEYSLI